MAKTLHVNASVVTESEAEYLKAVEVLSRAVAGLGLEGIYANVNVATLEEEE